MSRCWRHRIKHISLYNVVFEGQPEMFAKLVAVVPDMKFCESSRNVSSSK
jgi:hypothetical protein